MTTSVRALILRAFDHPSRPSKWWDANDSLTERGNEVAKLRADYAAAMAENVRLSTELAAANSRIADLERQADLSARQRNTAKFWVGH